MNYLKIQDPMCLTFVKVAKEEKEKKPDFERGEWLPVDEADKILTRAIEQATEEMAHQPDAPQSPAAPELKEEVPEVGRMYVIETDFGPRYSYFKGKGWSYFDVELARMYECRNDNVMHMERFPFRSLNPTEQAEYDALTAQHAGPVADGDGWIEWKGGECPIPRDAKVLIRWGSGHEEKRPISAGSVFWEYGGKMESGCIIAYRLAKPQEGQS